MAKAKQKKSKSRAPTAAKGKAKAKARGKAKPEPKPAAKPKPAARAEPASGDAFTGFPKDAFQFLAELALNNERAWFETNKDRYEHNVRDPALAFIRAMRPKLAKVSSHFTAVDKKVGGSLMRIYRDTRFSKDKSPYKTNVGIHFRHVSEDDVHAPGFYVHVSPEGCFVGVGMWGPEPPALAKIRARIDADGKAWKKAISDGKFAKTFKRSAEDSLKRPPKGFADDHPFVDDLKRRHHIATADLTPKDLQDAKAVDRLAALFSVASDYIRFQCGALGVPY